MRDVKLPVENDQTNGNELADELGVVAKLLAVVPGAKGEEDQAAKEVGSQQVVHVEPEEERDEAPRNNAHAANSSNRGAMDLAGFRLVEHP